MMDGCLTRAAAWTNSEAIHSRIILLKGNLRYCLTHSAATVNMFLDLKQLYARQEGLSDDSFLWPGQTIDSQNFKFDSERFNLRYFQRLDRQIEFTASRGIFYGVEGL